MKALLITIAVVSTIYIGYRIYLMHTLSKDLSQKLEQSAIILDVRTEGEFATGHIAGAINVPLGKLGTHHIPIDKQDTIITVCSHGLRSVKAIEKLNLRGYLHVFNGGAWSDLESSLKK